MCWEFLELQAQETASQVTLRELLQRGEGRSQVIQKFFDKGQVGLTSKDSCYLKKTRYPKLRNLVPYYEWAH